MDDAIPTLLGRESEVRLVGELLDQVTASG